jgi:predicted transcriptional regulator
LTRERRKVKNLADVNDFSSLSRRERQIMEIIYARGEATASDVLEALPDPPTRTAVRTFLRILEEKGHARHVKRGREFVFQPIRQREKAGQSALHNLLHTFFDGSMEKAVASHLSDPQAAITPEERERLLGIIHQAKTKESKT